MSLGDGQIAILENKPVFRTLVQGDDAVGDSSALYGLSVGLMVMVILGVMSSLNVILQGVVAERFGKICEMVLATMPAQVWIDGKLLAATAHGVKTTVLYSVYALVAAFILGLVTLDHVVAVVARPAALALCVGAVSFGLLFWNAVFAALASFLPTPNSPIRNAFIFIPMTVLFLVFSAAREPDSSLMHFFAVFPPTSPFALPVRLVYGHSTAGEVLLAAVLLVASIAVFRLGCARVFAASALNGSASLSFREALHAALTTSNSR
jgi:ABC-2 type transport system permease protein